MGEMASDIRRIEIIPPKFGSEGPGRWVRRNEHMSAKARKYQGTTDAYQVKWILKPTRGMKPEVHFDDWDDATNALVDSKTNLARSAKFEDEARRQVELARQYGVGVRWEVPPKLAKQFTKWLKEKALNDSIDLLPREPK